MTPLSKHGSIALLQAILYSMWAMYMIFTVNYNLILGLIEITLKGQFRVLYHIYYLVECHQGWRVENPW